MSPTEEPAVFCMRGHASGTMFVALQTEDGGALRAAGYSNQHAEEEARDCLPSPRSARAALRDAGAWTFGSENGPDELFWGVNTPESRQLEGGPSRLVFRLDGDGDGARWVDAGERGERELTALEDAVRWEETRPERASARAEDAEIEERGFHVSAAPDRGVWTYRERGFVLTEVPPGRETWRTPWCRVELPERREAGAVQLAPWCLWVAEDTWWRPEYDEALDDARRPRIARNAAAALRDRGEAVEVMDALPSADAPLAIPRVTLPAMRTILAFLVASGSRLASDKPRNPTYTGHSDPMEAVRGRGYPRKWYQTQGGEEHVHLDGPIPAELVRAAFRLPSDARREGEIDVSPERIAAGGGDVRSVTIWGSA
jgi:hypothetical protein